MRRELVLALTGAILLSACSDALSPLGVTGRYTFSSFSNTDQAGVVPPQPPFPDYSYVIDSLRDTVELALDGTYLETGTLGAHNALGQPLTTPIQAHGTYSLAGSSITLTPAEGSTVSGGSGTVRDGTLTVNRYPGSWAFSKQ